ncbi:MAG: undecaprenyldiphospho-muramoylpentapeptide beta-N-acetylglucosaminyltransferase [Pseudobdellovibrionaceae bacterium]
MIIIAGGGTGGHIYPGLAIGQALQKNDPLVQVHFVGTAQGLESKIVPKEGFPLHLIASGKLNYPGQVVKKIKTVFSVLWGFIQSFILLIRLRPQYVIGVGGYASAPFVLVASLCGYSTSLWEPNAHPGLANRWLSYFVKKCFVVFSEAQNFLKCKNIEQVGMPLRAEIEKFAERQDSIFKEKTESETFNILVFGGSQGAQKINDGVAQMLMSEKNISDFSVVHQVGPLDFAKYKKIYQDFKNVECFEYIFDMPRYYQWADLIICRGGASSLAEAAAYGKVPVIIPLPAADDHQQKNAESLLSKNAALMILQKNLSVDTLREAIFKFKQNPALRKQVSTNIKTFYTPWAAEKIAKAILS